jgi:deazaflavin-dependent oxidoreductase (nitroreductase family)
MAKHYRYTFRRRVENAIVGTLVRLGVGLPPEFCLLTARGRRSGKEHTNPVLTISEGGHTWLVAPYGEVQWVLNVRSNPRARLSRSRSSEHVLLSELEPSDAIPTLRAYLAKAPIVRPFFDVALSSSDAEYLAEAPTHPVFAVTRQ